MIVLLTILLAFSPLAQTGQRELTACDLLNAGLGSIDFDKDGVENCKETVYSMRTLSSAIAIEMELAMRVNGASESGSSGRLPAASSAVKLVSRLTSRS